MTTIPRHDNLQVRQGPGVSPGPPPFQGKPPPLPSGYGLNLRQWLRGVWVPNPKWIPSQDATSSSNTWTITPSWVQNPSVEAHDLYSDVPADPKASWIWKPMPHLNDSESSSQPRRSVPPLAPLARHATGPAISESFINKKELRLTFSPKVVVTSEHYKSPRSQRVGSLTSLHSTYNEHGPVDALSEQMRGTRFDSFSSGSSGPGTSSGMFSSPATASSFSSYGSGSGSGGSFGSVISPSKPTHGDSRSIAGPEEKRKSAELKTREDEAKRKEMELVRREEEAGRREDEIKRKGLELIHKEEEDKRREEDIRQERSRFENERIESKRIERELRDKIKQMEEERIAASQREEELRKSREELERGKHEMAARYNQQQAELRKYKEEEIRRQERAKEGEAKGEETAREGGNLKWTGGSSSHHHSIGNSRSNWTSSHNHVWVSSGASPFSPTTSIASISTICEQGGDGMTDWQCRQEEAYRRQQEQFRMEQERLASPRRARKSSVTNPN